MAQRFIAPFDPTRFPEGVGTANVGEILADLGRPDPTKYHERFDDFNTVAGWTAVTTAMVAGAGGLATITAAGSLVSQAASWRFDAGKRQFLKVRASAAGTTSVGLVGWVDVLAAPTTGVYVTFVNGLFTLTVGTATATYQRAFSAAEFVVFGIVHDPRKRRVELYVDNILRTSIPDTGNLVTNADFLLAAKATTADATLDYILAAMER